MLVDTRLGKLFVEVRGEGTPLCLWHSLLCDGGMWRHQVPALAERYRVINIDAPGHGRSATVRAPFTLDDCVDAAVTILDALEVEAAHWAGLSWGGMVALRLALTHRDRLRSMALLDTSGAPEDRKKLPRYHAMAFVARRAGAVPLLLDRIEPIFFASQTRRARRDDVERFREALARMDPPSIGHAVDAVIFRREDLRARLPRIELDTLVIVGAEDVATPPARARELADAIPGARYVELLDAGHLSALDQPEAVTRALLDFFERVDRV